MTCSNEENTAMPVTAGDASLQVNDWDPKNMPIATDISEHHHHLLPAPDSINSSSLATATLLRDIVIDPLKSTNNSSNTHDPQPFSGDGLLTCFDKLSMNESFTSQDASPSNNMETESACDSSTATRRVQESATNLLLFLEDEDGDTPLHICIMQEDQAKAIHVINHAPDFMYLSIQNKLLQTPLHIAALTNGVKTARRLVCAGADIQCQDRDGNSALHIACNLGHLEMAKQLLKPVMYEETKENKYPIPYLAIPQNLSVKNYEGLTCLHLAVLSHNVDILRLLLEAGADPNIGDSKSGRTPLHMAAEQGFLDCVSLLVSYRRTELDAMSYARHTPALLAYSRGHVQVARLLVSFGACYGFYIGADDEEYASSCEDSGDENGMDTY